MFGGSQKCRVLRNSGSQHIPVASGGSATSCCDSMTYSVAALFLIAKRSFGHNRQNPVQSVNPTSQRHSFKRKAGLVCKVRPPKASGRRGIDVPDASAWLSAFREAERRVSPSSGRTPPAHGSKLPPSPKTLYWRSGEGAYLRLSLLGVGSAPPTHGKQNQNAIKMIATLLYGGNPMYHCIQWRRGRR